MSSIARRPFIFGRDFRPSHRIIHRAKTVCGPHFSLRSFSRTDGRPYASETRTVAIVRYEACGDVTRVRKATIGPRVPRRDGRVYRIIHVRLPIENEINERGKRRRRVGAAYTRRALCSRGTTLFAFLIVAAASRALDRKRRNTHTKRSI